MRKEHERRRQSAFRLVKMVLGDPGRIEAVAFGVNDLLGREAISLRRWRLVEHAGEEAETLG